MENIKKKSVSYQFNFCVILLFLKIKRDFTFYSIKFDTFVSSVNLMRKILLFIL